MPEHNFVFNDFDFYKIIKRVHLKVCYKPY